MKNIRKAAVAGMFYPGSANELKSIVNSLLDKTKTKVNHNDIVGIVSPHAGYTYSGISAAHAYNVLIEKQFSTAIIVSPSHREYFQGLCMYEGDAYETPLGIVEIDKELREKLYGHSEYLQIGRSGHTSEHAVEVQLPFLQVIKKDFKILPIVIGDQRKLFVDELAKCLSQSIKENVIIIASSDLSHFYGKIHANKLDSIIERRIEDMEFDELQNDLDTKQCEACGGGGIVALLKAAKQNNYNKVKVLSRTDSGDFSGDDSSVVGYLSAVVYN
ncbi:MAG: AmmeMemoRadiSam system protein B [Ignavibacteriae bacterium HGW-Ignavibacteriae-2]|jgi:hypothetical protein|nr:AmmeMemoRadiSam system protein B [Bacteroidota bacterium]PKL90136.1 MAG: AmmeMemoRadiSam system protein B [Ignavibacteriae bacterium HGW-Ignavibacteriae-2]